MFENLLAAAALLLALFGLTELLHRLRIFLLRPAPHPVCALTLLCDETAVQQLCAELDELHWGGGCVAARRLIAVDCGLSDAVAADCRQIAARHPDVVFCAAEDLPARLKTIKEGQHGSTGKPGGNRNAFGHR